MPVYVERHIKIKANELDIICFKSKNLYNKANYVIRQNFINDKLWVRYNEIDKICKVEKWPEYRELPAQTSQQILKLLDKNWTSFFAAIKVWSENKTGFSGRPRLPKYKKKDGKNIVIFTGQQAKLKSGYIHFPKLANLKPLKTKVNNVKQVRIIPQATCYVIEVVYESNPKQADVDSENILSIDLGLSNLATCVSNIGEKPFIVNGRPLKSINQYFNKKRAELMSFVGARGFSNRISRLTHKRNMKVTDYLHKTSAFVRAYCIEHRIGTVIIGKNKDWKRSIEIGKRNNQNFVSIPFEKLIQQLEYKLGDIGIKVILTEESYTSKIDHLSFEPMEKQENYLGKRIKRGMFRSATKILINADVNGSIGIGRKVAGDDFVRNLVSRGVGFTPVKINIF